MGLFLIALAAVPSLAQAYPAGVDERPLQGALAWLSARTRADGCIGTEPTGGCGHATTRDAIIALSAAGVDPRAWSRPSPVDYLDAARPSLAAEPGACSACKFAKTIVALAASGEDPRAFRGHDHVADLDAHYDGVQMGSPAQINDDAWALYAYAALDAPPADRVASIRLFIAARQSSNDGGWSWSLGASEPWGTATALLALLTTGTPPGDASVDRALAYLKGQQGPDGLILQDGAASAESTAIAIQAVRAARHDPASAAWTRAASLAAALASLQSPDGSYAHNHQGGSRFLATTQALPALRGLPYPFRPPLLALSIDRASPEEGEAFVVQADVSDPDGTVRSVRWSVDGQAHSEGSQAAISGLAAGAHRVRASAEDDDGVVRAVESEITVRPRAPQEPDAPEATAPLEPSTLEAVPVPDAAEAAQALEPSADRPAGALPAPPLPLLLAAAVAALTARRRRAGRPGTWRRRR